jgi:hypothetical protein
LASIGSQAERGFEIVISDNASPARSEIASCVCAFGAQHPEWRIVYHENETNVGYDANLRQVIKSATGLYCMFMGDDDLMAPNALATLAAALKERPDIGVVLRAYSTFDAVGHHVVHRYFPSRRLFPAGPKSTVALFRRSTVLSGITVRRESAAALDTAEFDGTLLYQLYLVGMIAAKEPSLVLPEVLALYRLGGTPDFGASVVESAHTPGEQTPESCLDIIAAMLRIARRLDALTGHSVYRPALADIANYSYPYLSIQASRPVGVFLRYAVGLARLGLGSSPLFWIYLGGLLTLRRRRCDRLIDWIRIRRGTTPLLGRVSSGQLDED